MSCDCATEVRALREFLLILLRDVAAVRHRIEERAADRPEAPGLTPEEAAKAKEEADERARQKEEAFLRMRAEQGKGPETDEEDNAILSELWMLQ